MAERERSPRTPAGRLMVAILRESVVGAVAHARHLGDLGGVLSDTLVIVTRRRFATQDRTEVGRYVAEALVREEGGDPRGERARRAEAVIRANLGEPWTVEGLRPKEIGDVALTVVCDLVKEQGLNESEIEDLVRAAEIRGHRASGAPSTEVPRSRKFSLRRRTHSSPAAPGEVDVGGPTGPRSIMGQWLKLTWLNDKAARSMLPDDPSEGDGIAVVDAAFELAVRRRFGSQQRLCDIGRCVHGARERFPSTSIAFRDAEALIRSQLGEVVPVEGIDLQAAVTCKLAVVLTIADELALFDREMEELLEHAERIAEQRGFSPTPTLRPM